MSEIGVVHMDLMAKGGGEAVAMNVLEALEDEHEVTLLTLTDPDFDELNDYFNTDVDSVAVRQAGWLAPTLNRTFGLKYYILQNALLGRYARSNAEEFDLLVSTINELGLGVNSVQYVHFPFDWTVNLENRDAIFHPTVEDDSMYERLCTRLAGVTPDDIASNTLFANSEWTADAVEEAYGTRPDVLHPPVDTSAFDPVPWEECEHGFTTVGRIERSKRIVEQIRIVDGVRDRGHDVDFHVIGPTVDEEYRREVDDLASDREYVTIEGELPREELVERVCNHRFGLHGKQNEHFGMAVAELAAGGAIPFVPDGGGQHAIVRDDDRLLYGSVEGAVERVDRVLSDPSLQLELRRETGEIERRFGRERFKEAIRTVVDDAVMAGVDGEAIPVSSPVTDPSGGD